MFMTILRLDFLSLLFYFVFLPSHSDSTIHSISTFSPNPSVDLLLTKDRSVKVTLRDSVKFVILLHKVWKMHPYHQDYLGFYTLDSHLLSPSVHGLLGNEQQGIIAGNSVPDRWCLLIVHC